ncbi:hypothetical protein C8N35_101830 [Breoghania corrubedonensis]|uniref:Uncharacterized protein n=1 Tax=Breoghania corrubedonensis TaxID=665038 RepID=A0A2T5VGA2_9HYPH|nr:hypothetical protein C8N35_101830 [Breoghania corrubedonensis]
MTLKQIWDGLIKLNTIFALASNIYTVVPTAILFSIFVTSITKLNGITGNFGFSGYVIIFLIILLLLITTFEKIRKLSPKRNNVSKYDLGPFFQ